MAAVSDGRSFLGRRIEPELEAVMAVEESQAAVEAMGVRAALVAGELHQAAPVSLGALDRVAHHRLAQSPAAVPAVDADRLDQAAACPLAGQPRDDGELEHAHDFAPELGDDDLV